MRRALLFEANHVHRHHALAAAPGHEPAGVRRRLAPARGRDGGPAASSWTVMYQEEGVQGLRAQRNPSIRGLERCMRIKHPRPKARCSRDTVSRSRVTASQTSGLLTQIFDAASYGKCDPKRLNTDLYRRIRAYRMLMMIISITTFYGPAYNTQAWAQPAVVPDAIASCDPETPEVERAIWKNPYYPSAQVWGYADRHSVVPGETFDLMLSTRPGAPSFTGRVEVLRIGHPAVGGERELVWRSSQTISVGCQDVSSTAAAIGPGWEPTLRAVSTAGWRTGYYTVDLVSGDDGHRELDVAYIVVTDPKRSGDILVK